MIRPVVDRAAVLVRFRAINVHSGGAVVELPCLNKGDVSESIPLRTALRVQRVDIVVHETGGDRLDGMLERLALEGRNGGDVQGKAEEMRSVCLGLIGRREAYLRLTISPSVMSLAAAATLAGVRRLSRPSCISSDIIFPGEFQIVRYLIITAPDPCSASVSLRSRYQKLQVAS